jgi:ABC-2 type transport system ATP-binding protein
MGLIRPTGGSATLLGHELPSRAARFRIGFLPESPYFYDYLDVGELCDLAGRLFGLPAAVRKKRADELIERVGLGRARAQNLKKFSKGMLQRAGLAQALLNQPRLVFLDEPTSGLDPLGRLLVRGIIEELRAEGVTVFLNSHLLGEVEATCDRVAFVKHGRVVAERRLTDPALATDLELRVAPALDRGGWREILEGLSRFGSGVAQPRPDLIALRIESEAAVPAIVSWLVQQGVRIHAVQPRRKSLEEAFLEVIGEDGRPG